MLKVLASVALTGNYCRLQKMAQLKCRRLRITLKALSPSLSLTSHMGNQTPAVEVGVKAALQRPPGRKRPVGSRDAREISRHEDTGTPRWTCCRFKFNCCMLMHLLCRAQLLVKGCVKRRPQPEGCSDASLGFPFLVIMLVSVLLSQPNNSLILS